MINDSVAFSSARRTDAMEAAKMNAIKMPMIAMTTSNSTSVKPRVRGFRSSRMAFAAPEKARPGMDHPRADAT